MQIWIAVGFGYVAGALSMAIAIFLWVTIEESKTPDIDNWVEPEEWGEKGRKQNEEITKGGE